MKRCRRWISILTILFFFLNGTALAQGQAGPAEKTGVNREAEADGKTGTDSNSAKQDQAGPQEMDGVEALVDLLKNRGVISPSDAAAFMVGGFKDRPDRGLTALVELLKERNVIKQEDAAGFIQRYGGKPAAERPRLAGSERTKEYLEEMTREIAQEIQSDLTEHATIVAQEEVARGLKKEQANFAKAIPEWTNRIRWGGDIRLRYQADRYDKNNAILGKPTDPTTAMNTTMDQDHFKYRVRLGMTAKVNDMVDATFSLATGNETNPVSTNTALGNNFNKDKILIDQAYLRVQPWSWLTFYGGRMPNPWLYTDLVWDPDLNFDGAAMTLRKPYGNGWVPFFTAGAFPIQESDTTQQIKWLTAAQVGVEKANQTGIGFKLGAAYYNFRNMRGVAKDPLDPTNSTDWTAPGFQQKGNSLFAIRTNKYAYASEFQELNVTGVLDIGWWHPYHVLFTADYVKNLGFDLDEVRTLNPNVPDERAIGYQAGLTVGYPVIGEFGQWNLSFSYKYLDPDAVVDAFTDSDFHLGGTNAKGWILRANFGLMKNLWLGARWFTANEVNGPPLAIDVFQLDLNARL